jgi:hypothetical protein
MVHRYYLQPRIKAGMIFYLQVPYRDPAQQELANWIRFSSHDAEKYRDGLTTASIEIDGIPGWVVRNFYNKDNVMKKDF